MQFERPDLDTRLDRSRTARRVWGGQVHGHPDCWVVVPRDEQDLLEWDHWEDVALEAAPLRICRAILDDGVLVLEDSVPEEESPFPDPF